MKAVRLLALFGLLLLFSPLAHAVSAPSEMLANPVLEKRAEAIGDRLRCVVCQNESIEQSNADLAKDLRRIIREKISQGESDRQIIDWMVARYGTFILLKPPFDPETLVLWGAPVLALLIGGGAALLVRSRRPAPPPEPLTDAERLRLVELTRPGQT